MHHDSLEQSSLYFSGAPATARISDSIAHYDPSCYYGAMISVDLSLRSDLRFTEAKEEAHAIQAKGGKIVWDLTLDLQEPLYFEGIFNAHYQALKMFTQDLYLPFQEATLGCCLFRGECDLSLKCSWNTYHEQNFTEWLTDLYQTPERLFESPLGEMPLGHLKSFQELSVDMFDVTPFCRHLKNVHVMNTYAAYLHRLAAALPEELFVFVCLDARHILHPAYLYQLLSKERFAHLHLAIKGATIPLDALVWKEGVIEGNLKQTTLGVCFPNDPYCFQSILHQFKRLFLELEQRKIAYRIIPEFLMTSSWEGIDDMIFMHYALSPQGRRILQGFSITGGRLVYLDAPLGFELEISYNEFLDQTKESG